VSPLDFPLLTDENIAADVVAGLRARGCDVRSADEERLIGRGDDEVLERATALQRVIVTHDLAFGKVDIRGGRIIRRDCLPPARTHLSGIRPRHDRRFARVLD
jgi:hypothetical protein